LAFLVAGYFLKFFSACNQCLIYFGFFQAFDIAVFPPKKVMFLKPEGELLFCDSANGFCFGYTPSSCRNKTLHWGFPAHLDFTPHEKC